jgi:hypothetical protein
MLTDPKKDFLVQISHPLSLNPLVDPAGWNNQRLTRLMPELG